MKLQATKLTRLVCYNTVCKTEISHTDVLIHNFLSKLESLSHLHKEVLQ